MDFGEVLLSILYFFIWVAWFWLLIRVFADIFRSDMSGWGKAGWVLFVIILPILGVLIYIIAQGDNMTKRDMKHAAEANQAQQAYIRNVAGTGGTAEELEKLAGLKDKGVITDEEFQTQKAKLLA